MLKKIYCEAVIKRLLDDWGKPLAHAWVLVENSRAESLTAASGLVKSQSAANVHANEQLLKGLF